MPFDRELARDWKAVLGNLEFAIEPQHRRYLRDSEPIGLAGDTLRVAVRSGFAVGWLRTVIGAEIAREVERHWGRPLEIQFIHPESLEIPEALHLATRFEPEPAWFIGDPGRSHTFETYLVTRGNRVAFEAATALIADEARFSPLFVAGQPGLGKTHLLHALAWKARESGRSTICLSWTDLIGRLTRSLREKDGNDFKTQIRSASVLIVDDLRGRPSAPWCADELQEAMDCVDRAGGAVIVSGERPPKELGLADRLTSRLEAGTVLEIQPFDRDERVNYALQYCNGAVSPLPVWAIERICAFEADNVRTLRGALNSAELMQRAGTLDPGRLDLALAALTLREASRGTGTAIAEVLDRVAAYFGVTPGDILGKGREARLTEARAVAASALRERGLGPTEIGKSFRRSKQTIDDIADRGRGLIAANPVLMSRLAG
jgi:chromosomal replication initiator protein